MAGLSDNLIAVKSLIASPNHWASGRGIQPFPKDGRWTLLSATDRICWNRPAQFLAATDALTSELWGGDRSLIGFNAHRSHSEVIRLIDSAIAAVK